MPSGEERTLMSEEEAEEGMRLEGSRHEQRGHRQRHDNYNL